MSNYLKNMVGYTLQQLRGYSFDEIKTLFETTMRKVNTFVPIESEVDRAVSELAAGSLKRVEEEELDQESSKRQKTVPEQGMNVEALQTKYPIIDWEIYTKGTRKYWKIIRVGNHTESLVKEKFNSIEPTDDKEREIWVELKRLFKPELDDEEGNRRLHAGREGVSIVKRNSYIDAGCKALDLQGYSLRSKRVFEYILLMKIKLLIKKLEDSKVMIITAAGYVSTAGEDC
ncbi:hypothetical protein Tco_0198760 [Tanacetum coccineum]